MITNRRVESLGRLITSHLDSGITLTSLELDDTGCLSTQSEFYYHRRPYDDELSHRFEGVIMKSICFKELGFNMPCTLALLEIHKRKGGVQLQVAVFAYMNESLVYEKIVCLPSNVSNRYFLTHAFDIYNGPTVMFFSNSFDLYVNTHNKATFAKINWDSVDVPIADYGGYSLHTVSTKKDTGSSVLILEFHIPNVEIKNYHAIVVTPDGNVESPSSKCYYDSMPHKDYWTILTAFELVQTTGDGESYSKTDEQCEVVLFTTSNGQFLACKGSDTIFCCQIPLKDCSKIECAELPNEENIALLTSKSPHCCVVSIRQRKVLQHWDNVKQAFIGDFCQVGHPQVLLLFDNIDDSEDLDFFLTDFHCCQKGTELPDACTEPNDNVQKSFSAVAHALSTNLQELALETDQAAATFERKADLIKESWTNLRCMSLNMDHKVEQTSGLLPLFDDEDKLPNDDRLWSLKAVAWKGQSLLSNIYSILASRLKILQRETVNCKKCFMIEVHCQCGDLEQLQIKLQESLRVLKCDVVADEYCTKQRKFPKDCNGQLLIILAKSQISAEIDIYARSMFEASQILAIVISLLPKGAKIDLPKRKYTELLKRLSHCLLNELDILESIIKCTGRNNTAIIDLEEHDQPMETTADLAEKQDFVVTSSKDSVDKIRASFRRKRKRAEMIIQSEASVKVKSLDYKKYLCAMQETNSVAELLMMLKSKE